MANQRLSRDTIKTLTSNTTLTVNENTFLIDASSSSVQVTFPPASEGEYKFIFEVIDNTNAITLVPDGADTIPAIDLIPAKGYTLQSDGVSKWRVVDAELVFGTIAGTAAQGNDSRIPTQDENDALVGTDGTPSAANPYVTDSDPRLGNENPVTRVISANDTEQQTDDIVLADALAGDINYNLLSVASGNRAVVVKKTDSSNNVVNIVASGGDTIDGQPTYVLRNEGEAVTISAENGWVILGKTLNDLPYATVTNVAQVGINVAGPTAINWDPASLQTKDNTVYPSAAAAGITVDVAGDYRVYSRLQVTGTTGFSTRTVGISITVNGTAGAKQGVVQLVPFLGNNEGGGDVSEVLSLSFGDVIGAEVTQLGAAGTMNTTAATGELYIVKLN